MWQVTGAAKHGVSSLRQKTGRMSDCGGCSVRGRSRHRKVAGSVLVCLSRLQVRSEDHLLMGWKAREVMRCPCHRGQRPVTRTRANASWWPEAEQRQTAGRASVQAAHCV